PTATQTPTPSPTTTTPPPPGSVGVSQADFFFTPSTVRVGTGQKVTVANISADSRSEEHTSELQSLTNLVCRLLLEKKKNDNLRPLTPHLPGRKDWLRQSQSRRAARAPAMKHT